MKKTTQIFSASIITLFTLVLFAGIQTATAQEWLVFSNKSVLTLELRTRRGQRRREVRNSKVVLVSHFLNHFGTKIGKKVKGVSQKAMEALESYHWPGNVRKLENMIERGVILAEGSVLDLVDIPDLRPSNPSSSNT